MPESPFYRLSIDHSSWWFGPLSGSPTTLAVPLLTKPSPSVPRTFLEVDISKYPPVAVVQNSATHLPMSILTFPFRLLTLHQVVIGPVLRSSSSVSIPKIFHFACVQRPASRHCCSTVRSCSTYRTNAMFLVHVVSAISVAASADSLPELDRMQTSPVPQCAVIYFGSVMTFCWREFTGRRVHAVRPYSSDEYESSKLHPYVSLSRFIHLSHIAGANR